MTRSQVLNKYAKELYFEILVSFKPTFKSLNLNDEVERYAIKKSLTLSPEEQKKVLKQTKKNLKNYIESRTQKGSFSKFNFSVSDDDFIVGIANTKKEFEVFPDFLRYMINMNDNDFEKFSSKYIQLHFCDFGFATRKSSDGGIDFIGSGTFKRLVNIADKPVDLKNKNLSFRMVGQSKRYKPENSIGPKEIREFLGSVRILQEALHPNKESAWLGQTDVLNKIKLAEPFIYTFLTTSYYSDDAVDLANKLGIYIYDIDDMIFDLIEHKVGIKSNKFNVIDFEKWCRN
ncbi:restriction endonuclease [Flavobacterium hibisci]|uniref:restriction endonuclease n=1 Tax=Flavobacterium hibisci TaxID=1914462 RepID=UPI001CBFC870|nr:restriction endonuclease [Flavobacterium hibisci]MBZ4044330.1 restriction endonuclease [Flavobacterium hibisci]